MAPGRKRGGARGAKAKSQLSLGDLVLAKVKGFPAWPAKISKPEDWDRTPDPKKYFVQFFGTEEIAFVAPTDIQAFTNESKNKLSARCKGKTVKYFSQAVREICEAFEELQQKSSGALNNGNDERAFQSDAHSNEVVDDGTSIDGPSGEADLSDLVNHGPGLERCSHIQREMEYEDIKPSVSPIAKDNSSPVVSSHKREFRNDHPTSPKEEYTPPHGAGHSKRSEVGLKAEASGQKPKKMVKGSKVKPEGYDGRHTIRSPAGVRTSVQSSFQESASTENLRDGIRRRISLSASNNEVTIDATKPEVNGNSKKTKKLLKDKIRLEVADDISKDIKVDSTERIKAEFSGREMKAEPGQVKDNLVHNGVLHPSKRSKCADNSAKGSQSNKKNDIASSKGGIEEHRRPASCLETKTRLKSKGQPNGLDYGDPGDEDVRSPIKRRRLAPEAMSGIIPAFEERTVQSSIPSKKGVISNTISSPVTQVPMKRRAVRLSDDDDTNEPKTPVHGGSAKRVDLNSQILESVEQTAAPCEPSVQDHPGVGDLGLHEVGLSKEFISPTKQLVTPLSPSSKQQPPRDPGKAGSEKGFSKEVKQVLVSPSRSSLLVASKTMVEPLNKFSGKVSGNVPQKKALPGSSKGPSGFADGGHHSQCHAINERSKLVITGERQKPTPKSSSRMTDSVAVLGKPIDDGILSIDRLDVGQVDRISLLTDSRISDSAKSMKHLIAVAQAKRKEAQSQNLVIDSVSVSQLPANEATVRSPGYVPAAHPNLSAPGIIVQPEGQGYYSQTSASPSYRMHQFVSKNHPDSAEIEETRSGSGHCPAGVSLSGGTEAAVARDAFEGMIETLSRTKESIGRATRLAIDCAKYGIANEVVELLIKKLENEPSFHRRVDLFFLVDSITQCSHSQKGIAGASYIPTVQAALPRLLGAAAPPGASARENRRQCLKVLRLWLERKILPDTILRSFMDDIGASNDDTSAGYFHKRPSRSERAVDDPIREMDGMLVDEYGSNATFQLPGFLSNVFEEDDILNISHKENSARSPVELSTTTGDFETCSLTPNDRRHCILADVDGELEMEDVSGHPKDERPLLTVGTSKAVLLQEGSDNTMDAVSNNSNEMSPFREGSPPLPLDSPPPTPPLPSSPPPPPPPPPPPSPPVVPPPPSFSSPPPPPPPPPPSETHNLHPPHAGPPQLFPQSSLPAQPGMPPQTSTTPQHMQPYQHLGPSNVVVNARLGANFDTSVRGEMFSQQSCFVPAAVCSSREYGQETYPSSRSSQPNQHFQSGNIPLPQRAYRPSILPQNAAGQFPYSNPAMPHHQRTQHPYPPPHALTKPPDGPMRYGTEEQWRLPSNEINTDNPRGGWNHGGIASLSSGPPFAQEGYFRPQVERPPTNNVGFQPLGVTIVPPGAAIPGHSGALMRPSLGSWRPT